MVAALTVLFSMFLSAPQKSHGFGPAVSVLHCHDGDTCRIDAGNGAEHIIFNVRLAGIDAPELSRRRKIPGQPFATTARDALNAWIQGRVVFLRQTDLDPYNRPVVELFLPSTQQETLVTNINLFLLRSGLAERYTGPTKLIRQSDYEKSEAVAKSERRGIWSLDQYTSPRAFRRQASNKVRH